MLKNHPKGLLVAFFTNMGERFGFYTMMAILVLFLQAKYGLTEDKAGDIYSWFYFAIYALALIGGILADATRKYKSVILIGQVVMFAGYVIMTIPGLTLAVTVIGLFTIAFGNGLFKGNLQAVVGQMYDNPKYDGVRDNAYLIFYMGINIGAMFAPTAARKVYSFIMGQEGFTYNPSIPALANKVVENEATQKNVTDLVELAQNQVPGITESGLTEFSQHYIDTLSQAYHYGFGVACVSLIISMLVFWGFRSYYKHADMTEKQKASSEEHKDQMVTLTPKQVKDRLTALGLVFAVVIFFWMAFHQNGFAMTMFARDYTQNIVDKDVYFWFDLWGLLPIALSIGGLVFLIRKKSNTTTRIISATVFVLFAYLAYNRFQGYSNGNEFTPEMFQHLNPFFIVALTPLVVGFFGWLNKRKKEPSAPKKIGIGMLITGLAFSILIIGSIQLIGYSPNEIGETRIPNESLALSPYWLIGTYFTMTIAELFLSPMGISFVSKVSPPKYKGLMQGGWLAATALGNYLVGVMGFFWKNVPLWAFWGILVLFCILAATFIFSILKRLERATQS